MGKINTRGSSCHLVSISPTPAACVVCFTLQASAGGPRTEGWGGANLRDCQKYFFLFFFVVARFGHHHISSRVCFTKPAYPYFASEQTRPVLPLCPSEAVVLLGMRTRHSSSSSRSSLSRRKKTRRICSLQTISPWLMLASTEVSLNECGVLDSAVVDVLLCTGTVCYCTREPGRIPLVYRRRHMSVEHACWPWPLRALDTSYFAISNLSRQTVTAGTRNIVLS